MKNTYIIAGVIVVIGIAAFAFSRETKAPVEENVLNQENAMTEGVAISSIDKGTYELNKEESVVTWYGEKVVGGGHSGTIKISSGNFVLAENGAASGEFTIDMNTIESDENIDNLEKHLRSDDFFAVTTHPTGKFVLKNVVPSSEAGAVEGRYIFSGDLTLKGITKPVSFTATLTSDEAGNVYAKGSFAINRADWEVKFGSASFFSDLGDKVIRDAVNIGLDLKGKKVIQ